MTPADQTVVQDAATYLYQHVIADIVSSGLFFGLYLMAFILTVRTYRIDGRSRKIILAGIVFSFLLACWDLWFSKLPRLLTYIKVGFINQSSNDININFQSADEAISGWNSALTWPFNVNLIIGDIIVCWRAHVIWNGPKYVKHVLTILMIVNAVLDIADAIMDDVTTAEFVVLDSVSSFVSFGVNLLATFMITVTAWKFYWSIRDLRYARTGINLRKLLLFLIESGSIFCVIQLVYALIQLPSLESTPALTLAIYLIGCLCNISAVLYPLAVIAFIDVLNSSMTDPSYLSETIANTKTVLSTPRLTLNEH
ncbi:hypothetical protein GYMLUDRAFT_76152 [Collybiopsis luxurians FD-317 M1]|uniref:Uncharacterized protein n=1 Tax=Collybiopsis luxurians FD-317 M1 TaxID=944289 RepID=A0A0D0B066_9AGAR|nr:hypothetical protein GYMLUDRAFT_76152 [Collybiopsis luxurians FD-317 M1]